MKLQSCTWHYKKRNSLLLRFHITITNRIWLHDCIWALESAYGRIKCAICNGRSDTATNPLYELDLLHLWSMWPNGQMAKQKAHYTKNGLFNEHIRPLTPKDKRCLLKNVVICQYSLSTPSCGGPFCNGLANKSQVRSSRSRGSKRVVLGLEWQKGPIVHHWNHTIYLLWNNSDKNLGLKIFASISGLSNWEVFLILNRVTVRTLLQIRTYPL